jgi:hypothetical protein
MLAADVCKRTLEQLFELLVSWLERGIRQVDVGHALHHTATSSSLRARLALAAGGRRGRAGAVAAAMAAFEASAGAFATPVLLTVRTLLPARARPAKVRVYWPKTMKSWRAWALRSGR